MVPSYSVYGLNFPELVFFGILIYVACLILMICMAHWVRSKILCPSSIRILHCDYINSACACPRCSIRQKARNIFCCNRQHSIYERNEEILPTCKFKCFKPDCRYLRCFCCEFYVENESTIFSVEK